MTSSGAKDLLNLSAYRTGIILVSISAIIWSTVGLFASESISALPVLDTALVAEWGLLPAERISVVVPLVHSAGRVVRPPLVLPRVRRSDATSVVLTVE